MTGNSNVTRSGAFSQRGKKCSRSSAGSESPQRGCAAHRGRQHTCGRLSVIHSLPARLPACLCHFHVSRSLNLFHCLSGFLSFLCPPPMRQFLNHPPPAPPLLSLSASPSSLSHTRWSFKLSDLSASVLDRSISGYHAASRYYVITISVASSETCAGPPPASA
jgi:hypothetical protein